MGLSTKTNPIEVDPTPLRLWDVFVSILEWMMAIVAIMACGMLFSAALIPYRNELENTTGRRSTNEPGKHAATVPERISIDLPDIVDTSGWLDSLPNREQLFMKELTALNFSKPIRISSDYRLLGVDVPSLYEVHLSVKIKGREGSHISQFKGKSRTHFSRVGAASNIVELNALGLYIDNTVSLSCDGRNLNVVKQHRDNTKQSVVFTVKEDVASGSKCVIELVWTGQATADNAGLYETWYTRDDDSLSFSLTTHGETMHTRKWMPCFDEPKFKTPLKLSIEHPSDLIALSNAPAVSIEKLGSAGRSLTSFSETWPISTYLYAFSVTDYVSKSTMINGLPVSVYVPPPLAANLSKLIKDVAQAIPIALKSFNAAHMNKKIDFVFFADHASAMENPGHISLGWGYMKSYDTLVHEMMHQYFGNLMTLDWWSDLWINEGLANFYETFAMYRNDAKMFLSSLRGERERSMASDIYDTSIPLHFQVDTFIESRYQFRLPYTKGATVLNMLRDYLGTKEFDSVIEKMLNDRANSTISFEQFLDYLVKSGGDKAGTTADIARDFLGQSGYPLLVVRHIDGSTVIRQVRAHRGFVDEKQRDFNTRWTIPVHLTSLDGSFSRTIVIEREASEIALKYSGILIVDPSKVVNYRVVYDRKTYESIHKSKLSEEDRNLIEDDLIVATWLGYTDIAASYDTIMRRGNSDIIDTAHARLLSLLHVDDEKRKQAKELLEKLSGRKLTKRHNSAIRYEHPLRHRRDKSEATYEDFSAEAMEELKIERNSINCSLILNKTKELRKYSKIVSSELRRDTDSLNCILRKATKADMKKWIVNLFDNHDNTFHYGEISMILSLISSSTNDSFVKDFIVDELPEITNYYKTALLVALTQFEVKNLKQLKRLIVKQKEAAEENWIDIARIFERAHAIRSEAKILGPKVIKALQLLSGEKIEED